jgi:hypothetical protein
VSSSRKTVERTSLALLFLVAETVRFPTRAGDAVTVDPEDGIPEIAEHNNRLRVQISSGQRP